MTDITTRGKYQDDIQELRDLETYDFENIFKMCYDVKNQAYFYNILKTVNIPDNINNSLYTTMTIPAETSLTSLSYMVYGTIKLWWLICLVNNIHNPVKLFPGGTVIKVITPNNVPYIINTIKQNLVN